MTKSILPQTVNRNNAIACPWPVPSEGCDLEVARWPYQPSGTRNGGDWVYVIRLSIWDYDPTGPDVEVSTSAWRGREDSASGRWSDSQFVCNSHAREFEVSKKQKQAPRELRHAFRSFVQAVREQAGRDQQRYQRAVESQSCW